MAMYIFTINNLVYLEDIIKQLSKLNLIPDNMNYSLDKLTLIYNIQLTTTQEDNLNNFIASYIPILSLPDTFYSSYGLQLLTNKINDNFYKLCGTTHFIVDTSIKSININFVSFINDGNYKIRVYNFTTKTILKESPLFSNKDRQINTLNIDLPTVDSIIEIHIKVDNEINSVIIESAQINLYN